MKNKKNSLFIQLYFDEFEICDPLKSHAGVYKITAFYISIKKPSFIDCIQTGKY